MIGCVWSSLLDEIVNSVSSPPLLTKPCTEQHKSGSHYVEDCFSDEDDERDVV